MSIATDMKKLGEDIVVSYDSRVNAIGEMVKDTHKMLRGFDADRLKMSREQSKALSDFVEDLVKNVGSKIKGFQKEHKAMADDLRGRLDKGETDRLKNFKSMMGDINNGIKDIEKYVAKKLEEFNAAHADMSEALKKDLAKYVAGIVKETKSMLGGFETEREKMAANWLDLTAKMARKRRGKPLVSAAAKAMTVEEAVGKPRKKATTAKKTAGKKRGRKKKQS